ncbi:hypothetical protein [Actinomadura atramentaria]|uniref:hypothetical protein n=1 Tax=Actinomadura atramentaria TaxID=1990 RepID=UPI00039BA14F|nr:hypothetical protein [Actinomadura atramentaria]
MTGARYCDLVWLAYLVLPDRGRRPRRIALARRIADAAVAGRPRAPRRRRTRVLRAAARPSWRLGVGLGPWLRALPVRLPDPALTRMLGRLHPDVRIAYVLRRLAGLPAYEVRDQLTELRVRDPAAVLAAAEAAPEPPARPEPFTPERLRPVRRRSLVPVTAGAALTATLVAALMATGTGGDGTAAARDVRLVVAAPDAWRRGARTLDAWPARGELAGDREFVRRALRAFAAATGDGSGPAYLLFAGRVGGTPLAVLRRGQRVVRYTGPDGPARVDAAGDAADVPLALGGGRYLLPPWDTAATTPDGRPVPVRAGVAGPVDPATPCGRGPLFDLHGPAGVRTIGDLGGPRPLALTYRPPTGPAATRLTGGGLNLWRRLGCVVPQPARPLTEAAAHDFWWGRLPRDAGRGDWACVRLAFAGGGTTAQSALLTPREVLATGWCDDRRPAAGTWWKMPDGHWGFLAAAGPGTMPGVDGKPPRVARRGRLLLVPGPTGSARPGAVYHASAH